MQFNHGNTCTQRVLAAFFEHRHEALQIVNALAWPGPSRIWPNSVLLKLGCPKTRSTFREQGRFAVNRIVEPPSALNRAAGNVRQFDRTGTQHSDTLPLSSAQLGIWFAQQINPSSPAYNVGEYIEILGSVDPTCFGKALRQVINDTEAVRVQIAERAEGPRPIVDDPPVWSMPFIDVSAEADARAAAESWMKADLARPIDLMHGPLFRYALFKGSADHFYFYAGYHHIVTDGLAVRWPLGGWLTFILILLLDAMSVLVPLAVLLHCLKRMPLIAHLTSSREIGNFG